MTYTLTLNINNIPFLLYCLLTYFRWMGVLMYSVYLNTGNQSDLMNIVYMLYQIFINLRNITV